MARDEVTTMQQLKTLMRQFVEQRSWQKFHTAKNLAVSVAIESAELLEIFQWYSCEEAHQRGLTDSAIRVHIQEEMADVLLYLLSMANALDIDISEAVVNKLKKNAVKYPEPDRVCAHETSDR